MAMTTGAERKILKIFSHAPPVASRSFGSRSLARQPLMMYIICVVVGWGCFYEASGHESTSVCGPTRNNCIVPGLLINMKGGWGTIPAVLSGANRGKQGALKLSRGPINGSLCCLAVIHTAGLIASDVGYVSVYLRECVCVCVCACAHSWDGGNCVSVFTPWLNISSTALNCWLVWPYQHNLFHPLPSAMLRFTATCDVNILN